MCACLREIALVVRPVFLNQRQAVKTQEVLVWQISARDGKMRSICQKHIRTSKQPEINVRLKIKVKTIQHDFLFTNNSARFAFTFKNNSARFCLQI
jgi:hypothetical protein